MIHTQYYALLRGLSQLIDSILIKPVVQWDYNYNSVVIDQLKRYGKVKEFPKGFISINNVNKTQPIQARNYTPGIYVQDLVTDPVASPLAQVRDKFAVYGLFNWYEIGITVQLRFENNPQLIDAYHAIQEQLPLNFLHYAFEYPYYVQLDRFLMDKEFNPYEDESDNIYANQMKDDASNFEFFTLVESTPLLRMNSIDILNEKNASSYSLSISFTIRDRFLYQLLYVDIRYFLKLAQVQFVIKVQLDNGETEEVERYPIWNSHEGLEYKDEPTPSQEYPSTDKGTNNDTSTTDTVFQGSPEPSRPNDTEN